MDDFPQRLMMAAPIGSLMKRAEGAARVMREQPTDQAYLRLIRQLPCLHCGMEPSEPAHVRMASAAHAKASGLGRKPADCWAVPLCAEHHRLARNAQHNRGEREFWRAIDINPLVVCERLYARRGDLPAMLAIVQLAIAERKT